MRSAVGLGDTVIMIGYWELALSEGHVSSSVIVSLNNVLCPSGPFI